MSTGIYPDAFNGALAIGTVHIGLQMSVEDVVQSIHIQGDAAWAGTITLWDSNFGPQEVPIDSVVVGDWIQENPTSGVYVGFLGTGWGATGLTITAAGTGAGGAMAHVGNIGSKRLKLQVVTTTGGILRIMPNSRRTR